MKIAVAGKNKQVAEHFGYCDTFFIYTSKNREIINSDDIANPGHKPGFLPNFLNELGVNVIIAGGMGSYAVEIFNSHQIEVIIGASGDCQEAAKKYLSGEMESTGTVCHEHD